MLNPLNSNAKNINLHDCLFLIFTKISSSFYETPRISISCFSHTEYLSWTLLFALFSRIARYDKESKERQNKKKPVCLTHHIRYICRSSKDQEALVYQDCLHKLCYLNPFLSFMVSFFFQKLLFFLQFDTYSANWKNSFCEIMNNQFFHLSPWITCYTNKLKGYTTK